MADEPRGWRVVEGPGTESTDETTGPEDMELGRPNEDVLGAGYGASTGGLDGEPGPPGAAIGEIPEHTGPVAIEGMEDLFPFDEEDKQ